MTLETCPFCGSDNVYSLLDCTCIFCDDCGALGPVCVDRNPEILWNKRAEPEEIPQWLKNELIYAVVCAKDDETKGWNDALGFVLSLNKPEETP